MRKIAVSSLCALALATLIPVAAQAQVLITEVDAASSTAATGYNADWFELKNIGSSTLDITGWKIDDSSAAFGTAVALRGITSIAAGQSVIFLEGNATGTTDSTIDAAFATAWFGANVPAGLLIGNYGGSGIGLSTGGDGVTIFDASGVLQAFVTFGVTSLGATLDNTAGINGPISQNSAVGVNGAFLSANGVEVGSPGGVAPVPEPATLALSGIGLAAVCLLRRNRKA